MSYLRYTNKIDIFNITTEPTEYTPITNSSLAIIKEQLVKTTEINIIIGVAISVAVITFVGLFYYCKKKDRNCF